MFFIASTWELEQDGRAVQISPAIVSPTNQHGVIPVSVMESFPLSAKIDMRPAVTNLSRMLIEASAAAAVSGFARSHAATWGMNMDKTAMAFSQNVFDFRMDLEFMGICGFGSCR